MSVIATTILQSSQPSTKSEDATQDIDVEAGGAVSTELGTTGTDACMCSWYLSFRKCTVLISADPPRPALYQRLGSCMRRLFRPREKSQDQNVRSTSQFLQKGNAICHGIDSSRLTLNQQYITQTVILLQQLFWIR